MGEVEVVRIPVEPGAAAELTAAVAAAREGGYLAPPRCAGLRLLVAAESDELLVIVDWRSVEDHAEAAAGPQAAELFGRLGELAASPPNTAWYRERG